MSITFMNLEHLSKEKQTFMSYVKIFLFLTIKRMSMIYILKNKKKLPSGLFCEGQTYREDTPKVPNSFSYTQEIIFDGFRSGGQILNVI